VKGNFFTSLRLDSQRSRATNDHNDVDDDDDDGTTWWRTCGVVVWIQLTLRWRPRRDFAGDDVILRRDVMVTWRVAPLAAHVTAARYLHVVALATPPSSSSLHFAWVVDDAKCIVVTRVCVSVSLSATACLHYCTDPGVTWGTGRGCPLVVKYWADLQSVHGLRRYGNITRTRNVSEYMLVLALCLVQLVISAATGNSSAYPTGCMYACVRVCACVCVRRWYIVTKRLNGSNWFLVW